MNTIEQPPYSPDLAPWGFFLLSRLKLPLRGTRFDLHDDNAPSHRARIINAVETSRPQWYSANFLQKQYRMQVAADMLDGANSDPTFMGRIITGDETWVYEYDTLTSQQPSEWVGKNEPKPKKPRQSRSKIKKMLIVFFDIRCVVHHEFVPQGQTVNYDFYLAVLGRLRENIRRKRSDLWQNNSWILHDGIEQPPYSLDLAPCDFSLFFRLKLPLRGTRFDSIDASKENSQKELKAIAESAYKKCFDDWKKRWHMCIASNGAYFEGDSINIEDTDLWQNNSWILHDDNTRATIINDFKTKHSINTMKQPHYSPDLAPWSFFFYPD